MKRTQLHPMNATRYVPSIALLSLLLAGCLGAGAPTAQPTPSPTPAATPSRTAAPAPIATPDQTARRRINLSEEFNEMSAVLNRACTIDDRTAPGLGAFGVTVVNETAVQANVDIWRISDSHTYADFRAFVAAANEAPAWADRWFSLSLGPGESATDQASLGLGTHGIVCTFENGQTATSGSASLIGPLEIEQ
jgi:hypothetical protein